MHPLAPGLLSGHALDRLLQDWGYGVVLAVVALQSLGAPLPGTTAVVAGALYAAETHRLQIYGVVAAGALGAILGSLAAYGLGRRGGGRVLERFGPRLGLPPARLIKLRRGFARHGTALVFIGRFITGLRNSVGLLAGASRMPLGRFTLSCASAALLWALWNGLGTYLFGEAVTQAPPWVSAGLVVLGVATLMVTGALIRRAWNRLDDVSPAPPPVRPQGDNPLPERSPT